MPARLPKITENITIVTNGRKIAQKPLRNVWRYRVLMSRRANRKSSDRYAQSSPKSIGTRPRDGLIRRTVRDGGGRAGSTAVWEPGARDRVASLRAGAAVTRTSPAAWWGVARAHSNRERLPLRGTRVTPCRGHGRYLPSAGKLGLHAVTAGLRMRSERHA